MKSLMTPLFYYSGSSLDLSERLIWSNWQCTISWWLQRLYYRQNTLSLPRRHRKRVVWKMSRIKNKFFSRRSVDSVRVLLKKKLKERKKKQTRLYVALHFNLFTPRTIYERFEGGNDPRSWINDLSGWKNKKLKNSGLTGNRTLTFAMTARNALDPLSSSSQLETGPLWGSDIYPVVKMTWMKIDGMTHTLSCG